MLFKTPAMAASIWEAEQEQWRQLGQGVGQGLSPVDPAQVILAGLSMVLLPLPLVGLGLLIGGIVRRLVARVIARRGRTTVPGSHRAGHRSLEVTMSGSKPDLSCRCCSRPTHPMAPWSHPRARHPA